MSILNDFAIGKAGEDAVVKLLEGADVECERNTDPATRAFYDLVCDHPDLGSFEVEIKNDVYAARTGNIAIEFWNSKKDSASGINITTAPLWVHIAREEIWMANVEALKQWVETNEPKRTIFGGGDGNADFHLFEADTIFPAVFTRIDEDSKEELLSNLDRLLR